MANPTLPAVPQAFSFRAGQQTLQLLGVVTGFTGRSEQRSASHVFPKRAGGREEPMGAAQRQLEVRLQFLGTDCASQFQKFDQAIRANPVGLLVHPVYGRWTAFCHGPQHTVALATAVDQLEVSVSWKESQLDAPNPTETPDVATGAQNVTGQIAKWEQTIAGYMAEVAIAQGLAPNAQIAITAVLDVLSALSSPIDSMKAVIDGNLGNVPAVLAAINDIASSANSLAGAAATYVNTSTDLFNGDDSVTVVSAAAIATELGILQDDTDTLMAALLAASPSPAAAGDAASDTIILLELCLTLSDAVQAAQPPTVLYTVVAQANLVVLAQKIIASRQMKTTAAALAQAILGLNQIPNPAAIPSGTQLLIPTQ